MGIWRVAGGWRHSAKVGKIEAKQRDGHLRSPGVHMGPQMSADSMWLCNKEGCLESRHWALLARGLGLSQASLNYTRNIKCLELLPI